MSKTVADLHKNEYGRPAGKIKVIYSGVATQSLEVGTDQALVDQTRTELGIDSADPILINVARLHPMKGQRFLIQMMRQVVDRWPTVRLLIVGGGSPELRAELGQIAADSGVEQHISFLGTRTDVSTLLKLADVFVFPSLSEGLPMAVIEAMIG